LGIFRLFEQATNRSAGDAVSLRDFGQAIASGTIPKNGNPIDLDRTPADMPTLQPGAAHADRDPFDDKVALELRDGADDDDHGTPPVSRFSRKLTNSISR
jgi:hypothetical protein